jgi:acid phosphatase family membrane protein YuiD
MKKMMIEIAIRVGFKIGQYAVAAFFTVTTVSYAAAVPQSTGKGTAIALVMAMLDCAIALSQLKKLFATQTKQ